MNIKNSAKKYVIENKIVSLLSAVRVLGKKGGEKLWKSGLSH
jgi:hypothetical protein